MLQLCNQCPRKSPTARRAVASVSRPLPRNHSIVHVIILVSEEGVLPSPDYKLDDCSTATALLHMPDFAT